MVLPQQLSDRECFLWGAELLLLYPTILMYYAAVSSFLQFLCLTSNFADLAKTTFCIFGFFPFLGLGISYKHFYICYISIMALSIMAFSIMIFSIMTFSIMIMTLSMTTNKM
jgi:hypothetical protein